MALQVWLPYINDKKNYGLIPNQYTETSTLTWNNNGKLGKCVHFNENQFVVGSLSLPTTKFSVAYWVKYTTFPQYNMYVAALNNATSSDYHFMIGVNGSKYTLNASYSADTLSLNTWYHCAYTYDGTVGSMYLDGVLVKSITGPTVNSGATHLVLNGRSNNASNTSFTGAAAFDLNDLRIYDECLSAKQVHELAKGLVLHYKLDNNGFGGENLLLRTNQGTACWGYNIGNRYIQPTRTTIEWLGVQAMQAVTNGVNDSYTSAWCLIYYNDSNIYKVLQPSTQYTISFDSTNRHTSLNIRQGNGLNPMLTAECNLSSIERKDENGETYYHLYGTFTTVASFEGSGQYVYISSGMGYMSTAGNTVKYANIKIEEGTRDTSWCPNRSDTMGVALGMNDEIEYDCSGYGRNGTIVGALKTNSDSPRYDACTDFVSNAYIEIPLLPSDMSYATYSLWVNTTTVNSYKCIYIQKGNPTGNSSPWISVNTENSGFWVYYGGGGSPTYVKGSSSTLTGWHHLCFVWNDGVAQRYLDGKPLGDSVTYTNKVIKNNVASTLGDSYTGTTWSGAPFEGSISDFRIYATALSADDILDLYNVGQSIDNHGNLYAYSYKEE